MVCSPANNNLNPGIGPSPPNIPGFGFPYSVPAIPFPDLKLPDGIPEDLLALIQQLLARMPGSLGLTGAITNFSKDVMDVIASLLNQIAPYLSLYNFFQALLNMIMCILDVLCSLMNPFAVLRALHRLFKRCLPDFLNLFPWLALIAMIIALLLLLLALIDYLIAVILGIIRDIIENLLLLSKIIAVKGTESDIIAAARKIAFLLCMIEQLFAILIAFKAIMAVIESLAKIAGRSVCGSGSGNDDACCSKDVCPDFISQATDGLTGVFGELIYHSQVDNVLIGLLSNLVMPPARSESWQFNDVQTQQFNIKDIITESPSGNIYWPEGLSFQANSNLNRVPYTIDLTLTVDPFVFNSADTKGAREFVIKKVILTQKPFIGTVAYNGVINTNNTNGTSYLQGGLVYESDGTTPYLINNVQATLNTFIHKPAQTGAPISEDGYIIQNIKYTLNPNHAPLAMTYGLITAGCIPSVASERAIITVVNPQLASVVSRIGTLPDINGSLDCMNTALAKFRLNVSPDAAAVFQADMETCLNNLRAQTVASYTAAVAGGVSVFKTTVALNPNLQFTGLPIKVSVTLRDPSGTNITQNMPPESQTQIASLITAQATFGTVSTFVYDGYQDFVADINSSVAGTGEITTSFENNVISIILGQDSDTTPTSIQNVVNSYEFIGSSSATPVIRRDETDVGGD